MLLTSKLGSTGITFIFLTTVVLGQGVPLTSAVSVFNKDRVTVFVIKNEIKKMQETLQGRGYYGGEVDGIIGLRTRASLRAYQKAENLPTTGQVDTRTAAGLGVRPESTWRIPKVTGGRLGTVVTSLSGILREVNLQQALGGLRVAGMRARNSQGLL